MQPVVEQPELGENPKADPRILHMEDRQKEEVIFLPKLIGARG
jgi:hypothetical protein